MDINKGLCGCGGKGCSRDMLEYVGRSCELEVVDSTPILLKSYHLQPVLHLFAYL